MDNYYMIEQIFYTEGFPVISFSICKILQTTLYNNNNKLDFRTKTNNYNPKLFETKEEALDFIRKALINKETHDQDNFYRYFIVEYNINLNKLNRLSILV